MSLYNSIATIFLILLTIFYISLERVRYNRLKELIEFPLEYPILISNLKNSADITKLIESYAYINNDSPTDMKRIILELKYLKETVGKNQSLEDLTKMVTSAIPLTAIMVTVSIALFKDSKILVGFGQLTINFIAMLLISLFFITFYSFINNFSSSKISILINKHLLIAEEVHKGAPSVDADDVAKSD